MSMYLSVSSVINTSIGDAYAISKIVKILPVITDSVGIYWNLIITLVRL